MQIPFHLPCVTENDFDAPLPSVQADMEHKTTSIHPAEAVVPVQYHIIMARIAITHHRFHVELRAKRKPLINIVRDADDRLAGIINTLPAHLQPDEMKTDQTEQRDERNPWIAWQRYDLTLVLLYFRLLIHHTLQGAWLASPDEFSGPRAICLNSAKGIIWLSRQWDQPVARRRQW